MEDQIQQIIDSSMGSIQESVLQTLTEVKEFENYVTSLQISVEKKQLVYQPNDFGYLNYGKK